MKLVPDTLALFSRRAQQVLRRVTRAVPPSREIIMRKLHDTGRPVFEAVVDFERRFDGVRIELGPLGEEQTFELGIAWHAPPPDSEDPADPERTMVPIGSGWSGQEYLYMNAEGEIVCHFDQIIMKSSSVVRYIEQQVLGLTPRWRPPHFGVDLRPALGRRLAEKLHLQRVEEASDQYVSWWMGRGLSLQQVSFCDSWKAQQTSVFARSISDVARVLDAAASLEPKLAVAVGATPLEQRRPTKRQRASVPSMDSWAGSLGARRYSFGNEDPHLKGAVWVVPEHGTRTIQQYRIFVDDDGEELLARDVFNAAGGVVWDMDT